MSEQPLFERASPFMEDILALPVLDVEVASQWYQDSFGLTVVRRSEAPHKSVVMERDGVQFGFVENGGDSTQDGAAILVSDIGKMRGELESNGVETGNWRVDERDGKKFQVFFVVAPDGLCYYFHQPLSD